MGTHNKDHRTILYHIARQAMLEQNFLLEVRKRGMDNEKDIVNAVKSYLYEETKRRPMVFVTLGKS